jgi:hypothetical protein
MCGQTFSGNIQTLPSAWMGQISSQYLWVQRKW